MKFYADWRTYNTRYGMGFTGFLAMCAWMLFYPIALGKGFMFFEVFDKFFLSSMKLVSLFLGICLYAQLIGYFVSRNHTKLLEISDNNLIFNSFNGTKIELKYSEIQSLEYTKDMFKNFEFTLINGEKKIIYPTVTNKHQAFELIQQKLKTSNHNL